MSVRYPRPLRRGDAIAVTAPSSGISDDLKPRFDFALRQLRDLEFRVVVGECMDGSGVTSASPQARADELMAMLVDPAVAAVVPPWGGELAIDVLPLLDFDAIADAEPTWLVGYSDLTTLMLPLTLRTAVATLHGGNLMDSPYDVPFPLLHWLVVTGLPVGSVLRQGAAPAYRGGAPVDFRRDPHVRTMALDTPGRWKLLDSDDNAARSSPVTGRIVGGCLDTIAMLPGTPYGNIDDFAARHAPEGLLIYVEVAEADAFTAARMLQHLKLAAWFDRANAVLVGRSAGTASGAFTQHDAVAHALGDLPIPVFYDLDIGHVPPQMAIVNGALATVELTPTTATLVQRLV